MPSYYLKEVLKARVLFSDGSYFDGWEKVGDDEGILATEDPRIINELELNIRAQRGAITKLTGEQFLEWRSKKNEPSRKPWREEFKPRVKTLEQHLAGRSLRAAEPVDAESAKPLKPITPPAGSADSFRPNVTQGPPQ